MAATSSSSSPTTYFAVKQRSKEWLALRRPVGGTSCAKLLGFCQYSRPSAAYGEQVGLCGKPFLYKKAVDHGNKYEEQSERVFREWLSRCDLENGKQSYTEPGYDVPNPSVNKLFTEEKDAGRFGASLDVRGSLIDCEIKNPMTFASYTNNYEKLFSPSHFYQVQWTMAVRNRQKMYFIATSFNAETGKLDAYRIWLVSFAEELFKYLAIPRLRRIADRILSKDTSYAIEEAESPWINHQGRYTRSPEYLNLFQHYCELKFSYP